VLTAESWNKITFALAAAGLWLAGSLAVAYLSNTPIQCGVDQGCEALRHDPRSYLMGVPVPAFGFALYLAVAISTFIRLPRGSFAAAYALSSVGAFVSVALIGFSRMALGVLCPWCALSGIVMVLVLASVALAAATGRQWVVLPKPSSTKKRSLVIALTVALSVWGGLVGLHVGWSPGIREDRLISLDRNVFEGKGAHVLNRAGSKALVVFADLDCPACAYTVPRVLEVARRNPSTEVILHISPIKRNGLGRLMAFVSEISEENGVFWDYCSRCFASRSTPSLAQLAVFAHSDPLTIKKRLANPQDPAMLRVKADRELCQSLEVIKTPVFLVYAEGSRMRPTVSPFQAVMLQLGG
jgi:uncharacterized membrane protein